MDLCSNIWSTIGMQLPRIQVFIVLILAVGAIRFALSVSGFPNDLVKWVSMSAVIAVGIVYYGLVCDGWKQRLKAAYLLTLPYMVVEAAALGYGLATGKSTISHTPEYSFGTSLRVHFLGHIIG